MKVKYRNPNTGNFEELINGDYVTVLPPHQISCFEIGKNLYKNETITGFLVTVGSGDGVISVDSTNLFRFAYCKINPNTTYTISTNGKNTRLGIFTHNSKIDWTSKPSKFDNMLSSTNPGTMINPFTFTSGTNAVALYICYSNTGDINCDIQVEEGLSATPFRQYGYKLFGRYTEDLTDITMVNDIIKKNYLPMIKNTYLHEPYVKENLTSLTHINVYEWYDSLLNSNTQYITKELLGNGAKEIPVYCYKFKPETVKKAIFNSSTGVFNISSDDMEVKRKKVVLITGTHGDERSTVWGLYKFINEMCNNWSENSLLEYLRFNVEFIIIPLSNPSGFDDSSRYVWDGSAYTIDLNREFPASDDVVPENPSDAGNRGGLTTLESQYIAQIIRANSDADLLVDFHNMQPQTGQSLVWGITDNVNVRNILNKSLSKVSMLWQSQYPFLEQEKYFIFGVNSDFVGDNGKEACTIARFACRRNIPALTLEMTTKLGYSNLVSYSVEQLNMHIDLIANLIISSVTS